MSCFLNVPHKNLQALLPHACYSPWPSHSPSHFACTNYQTPAHAIVSTSHLPIPFPTFINAFCQRHPKLHPNQSKMPKRTFVKTCLFMRHFISTALSTPPQVTFHTFYPHHVAGTRLSVTGRHSANPSHPVCLSLSALLFFNFRISTEQKIESCVTITLSFFHYVPMNYSINYVYCHRV